MTRRVVFVLYAIAVQLICTLGEDCDLRYYRHYEQKSCDPVLGDDGCPVSFKCKELTEEDLRTCVHNGTTYEAGDSIPVLGPCNKCKCELNSDGVGFIQCDDDECDKWEADNPFCYMGYVPGVCCPQEICPPEDRSQRKYCEYKGVTYKVGEYIRTNDVCDFCICTEEWTDDKGPGCSPIDCVTGKFADKIKSGCLPIYARGCCAVRIYCEELIDLTPTVSLEEDQEDLCYYQGKYYERGSVGYLVDDEMKCISCQCTTPPDFTCVRKRC